ncbi:YraN family protein [Candidatus Parcubacteria bacterium]|nr:MAG: YraN family protein [Candidatus Parcubacteria bacterium]
MNQRQQLGKWGEELACFYLKKQGYKILKRNLKLSYQEIDIVAQQDEETVLVEVKTRTALETAEAALISKKKKHLKKALMTYCRQSGIYLEKARIDFIAIDWFGENGHLTHYQDVFACEKVKKFKLAGKLI